ncbi:putative oxidoreductase [Carnobacterium sp. 17-4]|uniref:zinc-dependent alcohol dehydrogenase family protein n=1 Tax=Carnobacterium sp. (strain 17-4) TaxID=208596 RepID=UPI0002058DB0|nr:NAD(P)-dependent alcohol dehydrogenase [Carnobacterium sp. 17-4]AEB29046.1 putative oxidoreductase [Carnobacterium sp. 17-4]
MKALIHEKISGIEGLRIKEMESRKVDKKEVRIKVKIVGLNHRDLATIKGRDETSKPLVIGSDCAGIINEVGKEVTMFKVGDEVVVNPSIGWLNNTPAPPENFQILGNPMQGTFSEEFIINENFVALKPSYLTWEEAGVLSLGALTAYRALFTKGEVNGQQTILIPGIGGGVATSLLQFSKAVGAKVYVTSRSEEKLNKAKKIGAAKGINSKNDWEKELNGEKVDIVIESVGAATFNQSLKQLKKGGKLVLFGSSTGDVVDLNLREFFYGQYTMLGTTMGSREEYLEMLNFIESHSIKPVVDTTYDFEDYEMAFSRLEAAEQMGKIGIRISR